jgi:hypothetical protein
MTFQTFNRARYEILLDRPNQSWVFVAAAQDLLHKHLASFATEGWTQERQDKIIELEEQVEKLMIVYRRHLAAIDQYLIDCCVFPAK